mgnify:CR=1 FL=1
MKNKKESCLNVILDILNDSPSDIDVLKKMIIRFLKHEHFSLVKNNNYFLLSFLALNDLIIFISSFDALILDFPNLNKGLIIPSCDNSFIDLILKAKDKKLSNISDVLTDNDLNNFYYLFEDRDVQSLKMIHSFIINNSSPFLASIYSYAHKNTISYNVNSFIKDKKFDVEYFYNRLFLYKLLNRYFEDLGEEYD